MELKIVNKEDDVTKNTTVVEIRQVDVGSTTTIRDVPFCIVPESVHFHSIDDSEAILTTQRSLFALLCCI